MRRRQTFQDELRSATADIVRLLLHKAALANRLSKLAPNACGRRMLRRQKTLAILQLLECNAATVDELLFPQRLVGVRLVNGRRLHVPLDHLPVHVRRQLATFVHRDVAA